jgi:hypothetical protein
MNAADVLRSMAARIDERIAAGEGEYEQWGVATDVLTSRGFHQCLLAEVREDLGFLLTGKWDDDEEDDKPVAEPVTMADGTLWHEAPVQECWQQWEEARQARNEEASALILSYFRHGKALQRRNNFTVVSNTNSVN